MWQRPQAVNSAAAQAESDADAIARASQDLLCPDGYTRRVLSVGTGPPIVFIPLVAEVNFVWAAQLEEFSRDHHVILYEPIVSRRQTLTLERRAEEIVAVLDALEIERAHVVAWSDGGSGAYVFARTWPERCTSLVFIGLPDRYTFPFPLGAAVKLFRRFPMEGITPSWLMRTLIGGFLAGPVARPTLIRRRAHDIPELARLLKHSVLPCLLDHQPGPGEIQVPSFVISGDSDKVVSSEQASNLGNLLADCRGVKIISHGEHFLPFTSAAEVNAQLRRFLAQADGI